MNRIRRTLLLACVVYLGQFASGASTSYLQARNVGLFYDKDYVEVEDGNLFAEASNLKSSLEFLGHTVVVFNNIQEIESVGFDLIIIPELENKSFLQGAANEQMSSLELYINNGGGVIVMGVVASSSSNNKNALELINTLCDTKLEAGNAVLEGTCAKNINLLPGEFSNAPLFINNNNAVVYLERGLSEGTKIIYSSTDNPGSVAVAQIPKGKGSVMYFGWGWWNAVPVGSQDGGWLDLLNESIEELACESPTAHIESQYSFLLDADGMFKLEAAYFQNSIESCTETDILLSRDLFTCEDVGEIQELEIEVKDELGRKLLVQTKINILDPESFCRMQESIFFFGRVSNPKGVALENVLLKLDAETPQYLVSDDLGQLKASIPLEVEYTAQFTKEDAMARAVSTFDLVLLKRHVLGIDLFTNPYQYIAGDLNGDKKLNVMDMVLMEKLISHQDIEEAIIPNWQFIDSKYVFRDLKNPLLESWSKIQGSSVNLINYQLDIIAIKSGDVDFSY